jgi:hypothetical protein
MNAKQADRLGASIGLLVEKERYDDAYGALSTVLAERTPFRYLDRIGGELGRASLPQVNAFLERIARDRTEGGWVVIASALGRQMDRDFRGALARCRGYVVAADVWYGADIPGERVPGPALVCDFERALAELGPWRAAENRWVRRTVGVAAHFWSKRSRGAGELAPRAEALLEFLEPMFEEWEMDAAKGVGWGLKTLGRYYPGLITDWLVEQVVHRQRRHRALMVRKAVTYLSDEQRDRIRESLAVAHPRPRLA